MNYDLLAIILGAIFQIVCLAIAAIGLSWRIGNFEGKVNTKLDNLDESSKHLSTTLAKLDETNGGSFARCTQHNQEIRDLERRVEALEQTE